MNNFTNYLSGYYSWLIGLISGPGSYSKLLNLLFNETFIYLNNNDENRYTDGLAIRKTFVSIFQLEQLPRTDRCSVLEMMVALAYRIEMTIMSDDDYGDRTSQWFWEMIVSLGLSEFTDDNYNEISCKYILEHFMRRAYAPNGAGGLFTIIDPPTDISKVTIWRQAMWHLNDVNNIINR